MNQAICSYASLAALAVAGWPALASDPRNATTLTILVQDYIQLPDGAAHALEELAGLLLSRAGIRVEWVECKGPRVAVPPEQCSANLEPGRLVVRILARCAGDPSRRGEVLGCAVVPAHYGSLCMAQVLKVAKDNGLDPGIVMAYAAAHEIGHLLLGPGHGASGIMRAVWGKAERYSMDSLWLGFSADEAEAMRNAVSMGDASRQTVAGRLPGHVRQH